ncbi:DNA cytosine methyltransferase [Tunturiibacter gelidoferens]|uniref:DNA (cytosine-5-)-methyltransferase n=1 Tax=Tunturiibacter lichenicola TaxID=2051959 RepID=A0A7Y9T2D9_9BACT|nr:DNA (cytosine-5)-methyltransferase 1 [Edaphobacter lichenicola]
MIPVIDIFAGPGGLGEGFSALGNGGVPAFKIRLSLEKDSNAHSTLRLRAFYRQFQKTDVPDDYYKVLRRELDVAELYTRYPSQAQAANDEAVQFTLGEETWTEAEGLIEKALNGATKWLLIGGPPCQAYSLIGRSRNKGKEEYKAQDDARHFLYREYLRILGRFRPSVFVMENVKGLLSSKPEGSLIFDTILNDLKAPVEALAESQTPLAAPTVGYRLFSLVEDDAKGKRTYVVKAELHGIPQARHRVIIIGIRDDLGAFVPDRLSVTDSVPVKDVIFGLPRLRSGISRSEDSSEAWLQLIKSSVNRRWFQTAKGMGPNMEQQLSSAISQMTKPQNDRGAEFIPHPPSVSYKPEWFLDERILGVCNHASRAHIEKDLYRYFYAACYAKAQKTSPVLRDFPKDLIPNHGNVLTAIEEGNLFEDRFRVQLSTKPATTVTSHIAKDGHYYIHPDPTQCRSLTVREAARLQTFPDNYLFTGPRTAQYTQVGNAVPPLLANQIAAIVLKLFQDLG